MAASDPKEFRTDPLLVPQNERVNYLQIRSTTRTKDERFGGRNAKACIRCNETEEVVEILNLSRGGICLAAWKHCLPDTSVMVAAPCTLAGSNIFLLAHFVRAQRRATQTVPGREYALYLLQIPVTTVFAGATEVSNPNL